MRELVQLKVGKLFSGEFTLIYGHKQPLAKFIYTISWAIDTDNTVHYARHKHKTPNISLDISLVPPSFEANFHKKKIHLDGKFD